MRNSDMPAMALSEYQLTEAVSIDGCPPEMKSIQYVKAHGLTKREHFAGLAMQGLIANNQGWTIIPGSIANYATGYADALLKALEKDNG